MNRSLGVWSHEGIIYAHDLHLEEIPWEHCDGRIRGIRERSLRDFWRSDMGRLRGLVIMASLCINMDWREH